MSLTRWFLIPLAALIIFAGLALIAREEAYRSCIQEAEVRYEYDGERRAFLAGCDRWP